MQRSLEWSVQAVEVSGMAKSAEADREKEDRVQAFHIGGGRPVITHLVAEHLRD